MGFTPGEFRAKYNWEGEFDEETIHWELKDNKRIVLWAWCELGKILELNVNEAIKMKDQLELLINMCEE